MADTKTSNDLTLLTLSTLQAKIEAKYKQPLRTVLVRLLNGERNVHWVAWKLEVSQETVYRWIKQEGIRKVVTYE